MLANPFKYARRLPSPSATPPAANTFRSLFQQSKGRSESKDGIGSTLMPATQPHPLVRNGAHNVNKQKDNQ